MSTPPVTPAVARLMGMRPRSRRSSAYDTAKSSPRVTEESVNTTSEVSPHAFWPAPNAIDVDAFGWQHSIAYLLP